MKHTQGEWEVKNWSNGTKGVIVPISEIRFLSICQVTSCDSLSEAEANAKLIAAAPELLNACIEFLKVINRSPAALCHYGDAIKLAESATKKATL